jgi:hypothetical protein
MQKPSKLSHVLCFIQMKQFPRQVHHVLLLSAIPVLYPSLGIIEPLLKAVNNAPTKLLFKTGATRVLSSGERNV